MSEGINFSDDLGRYVQENGLCGSVGCAVRLETRRSRVQPRQGQQHSFVEIDREIFSTVILSLPLIQGGSCQFLAKECAQYWLTA